MVVSFSLLVPIPIGCGPAKDGRGDGAGEPSQARPESLQVCSLAQDCTQPAEHWDDGVISAKEKKPVDAGRGSFRAADWTGPVWLRVNGPIVGEMDLERTDKQRHSQWTTRGARDSRGRKGIGRCGRGGGVGRPLEMGGLTCNLSREDATRGHTEDLAPAQGPCRRRRDGSRRSDALNVCPSRATGHTVPHLCRR